MNKQLYDRNYPYNWEIMPLSMFAKDGNTDFVDISSQFRQYLT
jgi:hypothetical protein